MILTLTSGGATISVYRIKLPLPDYFTANSVNVFLIKESPVTLIDTGAYWRDSIEFLKEELKYYKLHLKDIRRILLTHGHVDHCGIAGFMQDNFKCDVFIHKNDRLKVVCSDEEKFNIRKSTFVNLIKKMGFSQEIVKNLQIFFKNFFKYGTTVKSVKLIEDGGAFDFETFSLKAVHLPGHTAGSCGFYGVVKGKEYLFSGDVILKNTFVTPVLEFDEYGSMYDNFGFYLKTLKKLKSFHKCILFPGHGDGDFGLLQKAEFIEKHIVNMVKELSEKYDNSLSVKENFEKIYTNVNGRNFYFYFSLYYGLLNYLKKLTC